MAFPATASRFHTNLVYGTGAALVPSALRLPPPVFLTRLRRCVGGNFANMAITGIGTIALWRLA